MNVNLSKNILEIQNEIAFSWELWLRTSEA